MNSVTRLTYGLLLLQFLATTVVDSALDVSYGQCETGKNNVDLPTAVWLKSALITDLEKTVPDKIDLHYCNTDSSGGITMYGYAECTRPSDGVLDYCRNCLKLVGDYLIGQCDYTGVGHAWDSNGLCYYKIGFTLDICPVV